MKLRERKSETGERAKLVSEALEPVRAERYRTRERVQSNDIAFLRDAIKLQNCLLNAAPLLVRFISRPSFLLPRIPRSLSI